jgi:3-deoxy-D-manno-octulosonic-acid transferase
MWTHLLDIGYGTALLATSPVWLYRMVAHGRYRSDWNQRLGGVPIRYGLQPVIWIHGVSLGEVNAARTLVDELHAQLPDYRVVISSTTATGIKAARRVYAPDHKVFRWPMDFSPAVGRALDRMRPDLVVLMEGEVWPNFLLACRRRGVPAVVVNGRLGGGKGLPRYRLLGSLAGRLFNLLTAIGCQTEAYAEAYRALGVEPGKIEVTGMLKYDTAEVADSIDGEDALAEAMGIDRDAPLIVAGGTGPGEEKMLLDVYASLRTRHPRARLAVVPRKPERFDEVARLIASWGFTVIRRSDNPDGPAPVVSEDEVYLGDTMGELRTFYSLATCCFVGRSLVPMGGSDMIESAALGKPTAFGPHTYNFPQADELAAHGAARVADTDALREQLGAWLSDPAGARAAGQALQHYVRSRQGATRRNVEMICRVLNRRPAASAGGIATDVLAAEALT